MITTKWMLGNKDPEYKIVQNIRDEVFVVEQAGSEFEADTEFDKYGIHLLIYYNGTPCATGAVFHNGAAVQIARICVLKDFRGFGLGDLIVRMLLNKVSQSDTREVYCLAQQYITHLYAKFGFKIINEEIIDIDGIPHCRMLLNMDELVFPKKCTGGDENSESGKRNSE